MMDMLRGTVTPKDWMAVGVILGLTALVCVLFFFFVLQDQNEKLTNLETEATQRADELRQAREIASKIDQLEEETNKIQDLVSEFEKRLPSQREIAALLTEFEAIAGQVGVDVELSPQRRTKDQRKETIPYKIVARGTFHQIANFINRLERYERYLKVSDLKIGPEEARICEATFTLSTFTFIRAGERGGTS